MMTLKDFVLETLTQVTEALMEFEEKAKALDEQITPFPYIEAQTEKVTQAGFLKAAVGRGESGRPLQYNVVTPMEFDVAVTALEEDSSSAKGGIKVLELFTAGAEAENRTQNNSVSRVHFKVPLQLPLRKNQPTS